VLCGAHARLAARGEWALNEKRLVRRAGLEEAEPVLAAVGHDPARAVQDVSELLRIQPLAIR
jgi:exonuclease VII large subunit